MWKLILTAAAIVVVLVGVDNMAHAQYVRACSKVSPLSPQASAATTNPAEAKPYTGTEYVHFTPSFCVSERYDSNVFFAPPTPGLNRADFVTDINPQVRANHNSEYVAAYLDVGGFYEAYVRNADLNFFGTADTLYLNFDKSVKKIIPNASLIITDYVRYTPTPPGFSGVAAGTTPGAPVNIQNVYAQGFLAYRSNNLTNNANVAGTYNVSFTTTLNASYSYNILRFGSSPAPAQTQQLTLFNSTYQTGTIGAKTQVSALDSLSVSYSHGQSEFAPSSSTAPPALFKIDTGLLGWTRNLTPYITTQLGGGVINISPGILTYALNGALTLNTPKNIATVAYNRSAYPSYIGAGVPVTSDQFSLSAVQKLSARWELNESANFAYASGGSGLSAVKYETYFATADLYYWMTRIWSVGLSFDYMNQHQEFAGTNFNFNRYVGTLSLKATWN